MRIVADPMPALRAAAVAKVNERYNYLATQEIHRDAAHAWKRSTAASVLAGDKAPAEFAAEADMLGLSPVAFAELISIKPNAAAQRELDRQTELRAIAAATHPDQLPQG